MVSQANCLRISKVECLTEETDGKYYSSLYSTLRNSISYQSQSTNNNYTQFHTKLTPTENPFFAEREGIDKGHDLR